jgi:hypothetical protein
VGAVLDRTLPPCEVVEFEVAVGRDDVGGGESGLVGMVLGAVIAGMFSVLKVI